LASFCPQDKEIRQHFEVKPRKEYFGEIRWVWPPKTWGQGIFQTYDSFQKYDGSIWLNDLNRMI
jgi:hypothetical protein